MSRNQEDIVKIDLIVQIYKFQVKIKITVEILVLCYLKNKMKVWMKMKLKIPQIMQILNQEKVRIVND